MVARPKEEGISLVNRSDTTYSTQERLVSLSATEVRILSAGQRLVVNLDEHIVTLLLPATGDVLAQGQFPPSAFRALILLFKSSRGASYAELLASLHCPESMIKRILAAPTPDDVAEFQAVVTHWQEHLAEAATKIERDPEALERELKPARWAVKEKRGIQPIARKTGFGWRIRALPRRGYILLRALPATAEKSEPHVVLTGS
jgi:hypothetical protein